MIRLFHLHYPVRALVFWAVEAVIVFGSLVLGVLLRFGDDSYLVLNFEYGYYKIFAATAFVLLFSHWFDLYDLAKSDGKGELYFRLLSILGLFAVTLSFIGYVFPAFVRSSSFPSGLIILAIALFGWRRAYSWLEKQSYLRERVYVLGAGERAQRLVSGLRNQSLGIDVVGWSGGLEGALTREAMASHLVEVAQERNIHRVIVAPADRRGTLPVDELLQLRLSGVEIEEATTWLEKIYGRIEVEHLYPSWLIFADGFRFSGMLMKVLRRLLSILASAVLLVIVLPLIPLVILAIKLDSPGPILYRQARVGFNGIEFFCYKFRTMRQDAEADTGPTWALDDDPRITIAGRFLRLSRLDEIPQLWNVLKGDMAFVGPRPERPEFVEWLSKEIPFYSVRHAARPGVTGWAQIRYKYGNTLEDAKEKLQYDLYYLKNASIGLDLLIMFQTIKIVLWEEVNDVRTPLNMPALSAERRNLVVPPPKERSEFGYRVMLVFSFLYYFHPDDIIPGLGTLHLARITMAIAILALILGANESRPKKLPVEVKIILAMFGWMILGIPFAFWRAGSLALVLFEFSKAVIVALALSITVSRISELRLLISVQAFSVALMAIVAVIVNNRMQGRLAGIGTALLSNPNDLAMNIAINWPLALFFFLTCRGFLKKSFWALSMLVMIYAVTATYSRAGFMALSSAILLCLWDFGIRGRRVYMLAGAAVCLLALVSIAPSNYSKRLETLVGTFQEGDLDRGSAAAREDLLLRSLRITASHPIFGIGPGNFQTYTGLWHVTHNTYTQFSAECGVPVLMLFLLLIWRAFRNLRAVRTISQNTQNEESRMYGIALRAALVAYILGACFASNGYELFPYYVVVYTLVLCRLTLQKSREAPATTVTPVVQVNSRFYRPA